MEIGLYKAKEPFRRFIGALVPLCRDVSPNAISLALLPLGALIGFVYFAAPTRPWLYLVGVLLIFCRMIVATMDGLVAVTYDKSTATGELLNRIVPELADMMFLTGILLAQPVPLGLVVAVLLTAWATSFVGLIGLAAQRPIQSVGPCGQTDRLAALMAFSLAAYFGSRSQADLDFMRLFLWWTVAGGILTILARGYRTMKGPAHA